VLEGLGDAVAAPALVLHPTVMPLSNDTNHTNHINPVADPGTPSATTPTQQVYEVVERVLTELGQPFMIKTTETISTPSIGVVLFYGHERPDDVLKWADMAMYQAKADGRNGVRFFDPVFQTMAEYKAQLELDLRHALRASQFQMWLQPQFDRQRRVVGAEALLRWHHPTRGFIGPTEFIPVAESSGLIVPLGHWVLVQACAQLQQWATQAPTAHWTLSVNVSARQFRHPDFVSQTLALIDQTGIRPQQLRLELTESMLLDDVSHTIERMGLLRQRGVGFSLDDFGTGYSSLAYLKQLPFVELKIDKSFVRDLLTDPNDAVLTQTMIVLAHALGLSVLAEGVETEGQFAALSMDGCDLFQGYLLGKPMPVNEFDQRWS
jgi:EAL domain-containing protein (putative c-di-GMP-specific phosphodiesterase class I)